MADSWPGKRARRQTHWFWLTTCIVTAAFVFGAAKLPSNSWPTSLSFPSNIDPRADLDPLPNVDVAPTPLQQATRTDQVRFDNYSLFLNDQRVFLYSGEFHTFRLPVPSLWPDILEKVKAAGLNAISVYIHMGSVNPSRGVVDFSGFRALQPLYDAAKAAGVWVVLRPEVSAGGMSHWTTAEVVGTLRTNATDWKAAWQPYIQGIIDQTAPNQISNGGPSLVYNEYQQTPADHAEYFVDLENAYHASQIVVPLTYNDPGPRMNFINGTGAPDLYGLDAYPQKFDCSNPTVWLPLVPSDHAYHENVDPSRPFYYPEFQGGSSDTWGPAGLGSYVYFRIQNCVVMTGPEFQSVFNLQVWASNGKLLIFTCFMGLWYSGTSWGGIPFHGVYTSYDYGASVHQRIKGVTPKYDELKRQSFFLRSSPDFYKTDWIADTSTGLAISSSPDATAVTNFKLNVATSFGDLQVPITAPAITLNGRQSKVIVSNYAFGSSSRLVYSTAQIFYAGTIDGRDVLFLFGEPSQAHEAALVLTGTPHIIPNLLPFSPGIQGLMTVWDSDKQLVLFADSATAATFWSPVIAGKATDPFKNFWSIGSNTSILYFWLRMTLRGDLNTSVHLSVIAPRSIRTVTWNGKRVLEDPAASSALTGIGGFVGMLKRTPQAIIVPKLGGWRFKDSLPEINSGFDDASCENVVLWRGHFVASGNEKTLNLSMNGGEAFAASVWVNDVFLNTSFGGSPRSLRTGKDNIITIIQDNMGLNESDFNNPNNSKCPRGVRGFKLDTGNFTEWKVQGKIGGYNRYYPDNGTGVFNEGGLFGERKGWHLPGFDTSMGLPGSAAGVGFFVTTFELNIPQGFDAPMSFVFEEPFGQPYRVMLFRVGNVGPQFKFPVQEGILDYHGVNTVAVALWAMLPDTPVTPDLQLVLDGVFEGGVGRVVTNNPKWSAIGR
ncbi:glycoside hydrolase superfamily [Infundibulicybe gibba]|nr:glycoside hydrolase superfamily [Infundibulicybe gibba]